MRSTRTLLRVLAAALLLAVLVAVPLLVLRTIGQPFPHAAQLRAAWTHRRMDGDLVIRTGASIFSLLWLWFAATALAEVWQVLQWRRGGADARLAPLAPGAGSWVRGLVRFVAVSAVSTSVAFTSLAPTVRSVSAAAPPAVSATEQSPAAGPTHLAVGRETPYSLAGALGRPELREQIIQLNHGRPGPDGVAWQGGVFPAGMRVVLPQEHAVLTPLGPAHEVAAGDSYWQIADDHLGAALGRAATPHEVFDYTESLVRFNQPLLGHRDPTLIVPGELVVFTDAAATATPAAPLAVGPPAVAAPQVQVPPVEPPPVEAPPPVVIDVDHRDVEPVAAPLPIDAAPRLATATPAARPAEAPLPITQHPTAVASSDDAHSSSAPFAAGLGTALMVSAGAVGLLESRRRRQLRAAGVGARLAPPTLQQARTEVMLRSLDASERLARLDVALRAVSSDLAAQGASVTAAALGDRGDVRLFLRGAATPSHDEWQLDLHANTWRLGAAVTLRQLAERAAGAPQPCPALVHVGGLVDGGDLFVDLEALGTLAVVSPSATAILRSLAASLAVSPFFEAARLYTVGLGDADLGVANGEVLDSLDAALDAAAIALGSTPTLAGQATTFGLRVDGSGGEAWEPAVVIAAGCDGAVCLDGDIRRAAGGGRGLAVVVDTDDAGCAWQLRAEQGSHVLEPLGLRVQPTGLSDDDVQAVTELLEATEAAPTHDARVVAIDSRARTTTPFDEPDWALVVRLMGTTAIEARTGVAAACERSKAVELVVWLSLHRDHPTRTAARTALWDLDVRDATFANVVSDARRAMARAAAPAEGEEWIARTLTEALPLHERVVTDAELLQARVRHARGLAPLDAIDVLRPGVELIRGLPFADTSYLWTDAEGITSSLVLLATGAAIELANHYLSLGDVDGVFWATGQGLKVLGGHEELIALRMRAHARRGDLAGVRSEWESYERAIAADPWAAAEPSAKLVALRRELLSSRAAPDAEGA